MPYRDYMSSPDAAPRWLLRNQGAAWLRASGDAKDEALARLKAAVKVRFLSMASHGALEAAGDERLLDRAAGETDASYVVRLRNAWNLWRFGGTATGLLTALRDLGYASAIVVVSAGYFYQWSGGIVIRTQVPVVPATPGFTLAGPGIWNRFAVIFPAPPTGWITKPADDDLRVELIRRTIRRWKSGFSRCAGFVVLVSGHVWGWPSPRLWGGTSDKWGAANWHYAVD